MPTSVNNEGGVLNTAVSGPAHFETQAVGYTFRVDNDDVYDVNVALYE